MHKLSQILGFFLSFGLIGLALYYLAIWAGLEVGSFSTWLSSLMMLAWLLSIVTVPWDLYFEARETYETGKISNDKGISISEQDLKFVGQVAQRALFAALSLHLLSALGFFALEHYQKTEWGNYAGLAALLLVLLRPSIRAYEYLSERMRKIRREFTHPRNDVLNLEAEIQSLEQRLIHIENLLDPDNINSWLHQQNQQNEQNQEQFRQIQQELKYLKQSLKNQNDDQNKALEQALSNIHREGKFVDQFLANLTEIIRFVKKA